MRHLAIAQDSRNDRLLDRNGIHRADNFLVRPAHRCQLQQVVLVEDCNTDLIGAEQVLAAVEDALEHRRGILDGGADGAQHLRRCGLPFERFLSLVEQAHVLDRDHGLRGEGLE